MTSRSIGEECFVYITLPESTTAVTAGRYRLDVDARGSARGQFVYGRSYLARPDAVELDPIELRLAASTYETVRMQGVFGAIRDASPDYWGRSVIQKYSGVAEPSEIDYLLTSPDDRAGALGFGRSQQPPAPRVKFSQTLDLADLQAKADAIVRDEDVASAAPTAGMTSAIEDMLLPGTSMGGARPKTVVEDDGALWVAKFNRADDKFNNARVERAMLELGRKAGLRVSDSRIVDVGGRDVLLVKRFDRQRTEAGYRRARMVSALTLLEADESPQSRGRWSYLFLAEQLRRISGDPMAVARELFRRMSFNALISNTDDHPRNHAVLAWDRQWDLSPAYDLTPTSPVSIERRDLAMICGDFGRQANAANLLSQSRRFMPDEDEARKILGDMQAIVAGAWYAAARAEGVSEPDCERIRGAFVYPGFGYEPAAAVPIQPRKAPSSLSG